jgi:hypothetical protein
MTKQIEKIPPETRWQIATKGLTGAFMACANALRLAVDEAKYNEVIAELWFQAGKSVKELVDAFGVPVGDARQINEAMTLAGQVGMGPELEVEFAEATQDRCIGRVSKCPWYERSKELGIDGRFCRVGHQRWGDGIIESTNPDFAFNITKTMPAGDPYCEVIIERKK